MIIEDSRDFLEIIDQISQSTSLDKLEVVTREMCNAYNLANAVYHATYIPGSSSFNPILIPTYDPEWIKRYINNDYFSIDPVVNFGKKGFLPLDWSILDRETDNIRSFFKEADRYGVGRHGVTMPIRGPGGERALFTITSNLTEFEWNKYRIAYMREFQIISHYIHDRVMQISGYRSKMKGLSLSRREMECLELTAGGMVPKRIASHLKISASAVRLYLRSACQKLDSGSVNQAVAKMITLELISPRL